MMNAATPQKREWPVIRVFVRSTFTDFKQERNAPHQNAFRKSLEHRTMQICFEELRRSQQISPQPNFLILLGNHYG